MLPSTKYTGTGNFRAWANLAKLTLENSDCLEVIEAVVPEPVDVDVGAKGFKVRERGGRPVPRHIRPFIMMGVSSLCFPSIILDIRRHALGVYAKCCLVVLNIGTSR